MDIHVNNNTFEIKTTPSKRRRESTANANKENHFPFNAFMEVKSIADLVKHKKKSNVEHPHEVARKPPKKKSKHDIDENCFVNPALNLNGPEKAFNPFEVKRMPIMESDTYCFTNEGLDIRGAEREVLNPFEVHRDESAAICGNQNNQGKSMHFIQANGALHFHIFRN